MAVLLVVSKLPVQQTRVSLHLCYHIYGDDFSKQLIKSSGFVMAKNFYIKPLFIFFLLFLLCYNEYILLLFCIKLIIKFKTLLLRYHLYMV